MNGKKYKESKWVACLFALIITGLWLQIRPSLIQATTARIVPPVATALGKTLAEWLGIYWRWYYTGADPGQNRVGSVQLLALPAGEPISGSGSPDDPTLLRGHLNITLKPGTSFVLPLFAWVGERYQGYPVVPDDLPIDNVAVLAGVHPRLTIDGKAVITDANKAAFYVPPTQFDPMVIYPAPSSYGSVAAVFFQGCGFVSAPLSRGVHEIHLYEPFILAAGVYAALPDGFGFIYDNTWTITVE